MMDFIKKAPWDDDLHESSKTLDRILRDINVYESIDSAFPEGYDIETVKTLALVQIAHYLKAIAEKVGDTT